MSSAPQQELLMLLDEASMRPMHYWLWVLSCGGTLLDGFSIFTLGVAMPLVVSDMRIQPSTVGLIGAAIVLGAVLGAAVGGPAGDRFGRKRPMLADMLLVVAGAALSAIAHGPALLFVGQLLIGMGIGIDFPVGGAYVSETMPKATRGRMMVATIACQSVGMLLAAAVAVLALKTTDNPQVWRGFLVCDGAIALAFLVARLSMPESAHWLMTQGRDAASAAAISRILPDKQAQVESLIAGAPAAAHYVSPNEAQQKRPGISALISRPYIMRTVLVSVPWFLMDVATYGIGLFTPLILGAIHLSGRADAPLAADLYDARGSATIDLFLLIGFLLSLWMVPAFGRIRMQVVGFGGMTGGMLFLLASTQLPGGAAEHVPLVFIGFTMFNLLMNAGPNATTFTLPAELFPTELRASAAGLAAGMAKLGATLGVFMLPIIKSSFGVPAVLGLMAVVSFAGLTITALVASRATSKKAKNHAHCRAR
jgi:MFS transporter, putative metabolite transport protein